MAMVRVRGSFGGSGMSGGAGASHRAPFVGIVLGACAALAGCTTMQPAAEVAEPPPVVEQPGEPPPVMPPETPAEAPMETRRAVSEAEILLQYFTQLKKLSSSELAREYDAARQAYGGARSDYNRVRLAMTMTLPNTSSQDDPRALDLLDPLAKNSGSPLSGLALLLTSQIQERRRLDANAQALQQKLDALKSLERSLIERKR
jgi:hypothetical protein